jgi:hypothetical protein
MDRKKSREDALAFLDYVAKKGLMAPATAHARKAALGKVLGILNEEEAQDITSLNLDDAMTRFGNLQGKNYTPASLNTYKSRAKAALDDFASYVANPLAFKPSLQSRERKPNMDKVLEPRNISQGSTPETPRQSASIITEPMANSIVPIPLRADLVIRIQGLPFDLTEAEANKIASVVRAMAMPA